MLFQDSIAQDPFKFILSSFQVVFKFLLSSFQVPFKLQMGGYLCTGAHIWVEILVPMHVGHALSYEGGHFGAWAHFRHTGCSIGRLVRIMKFQNTSWSLMFLCSGF